MQEAIVKRNQKMDNQQQRLADFLKKQGYTKIEFQRNNYDNEKKIYQFSIQAWNSQKKYKSIIKVIKVSNPSQTINKITKVQNINCEFIKKYDKQPEIFDNSLVLTSQKFEKNGNLKDYYFNKKNLNIDNVQRLVCKILIAVNQLHQNGQFHGRLKVENVLIDQNESVLLTDYCILEDDGFFLDEGEKNNPQDSLEEISKQMQSQDLNRAGVIITSLCNTLKEKEQNMDLRLRYNTKRCYDLQLIASDLLNQENQNIFKLENALKKLDYFKGVCHSSFFGYVTYEGEMKNDKRHGRGVSKNVFGDITFGNWENGKYIDKGITYFQNGDIEDKRTENYIYFYNKQQSIFEGEDIGDNKTLIGTYYIKGITMKGTYINRNLQGYGEIYYPNHQIYKGNFLDGQYNGYGEYIYDTGSVFKGNFQKNQIEGLGYYLFGGGKEYFGQFKFGQLDGYGKLYLNSGCSYQGQFVQSKFQGYGKYFDSFNSSLYEGMFYKSKKEGEGMLRKKNGSIKFGVWKNDVYIPQSNSQVNLEQLKLKLFNLSLSFQKIFSS